MQGWKHASRAIAFAWSLALASTSVCPPALARETSAISIAGGPLSVSLAELSRQTGISIGLEGAYPLVTTRPLTGRMSVQAALKKLLANSGLVARQVGAHSFRLERTAPPAFAKPESSGQDEGMSPPPVDIIVTASKRDETLSTIPLSLSVVILPEGASPRGLLATTDIARQTEGLSLTNLGPGRNRQFIRGIADSAFNGPSQSTVSLQIDDTRATFNAPDPDLRLVDVERVEVLKGPQGPLYGTGALGGVYHIVTRKPDLGQTSGYASLEGSSIRSGGSGGGGSAMLNLPLYEDRVGVRLVAYGAHEAGWVDNGDQKNVNDLHVYGGRLTLRAVPAEDWALDLGVMAQFLRNADSQYVFAPKARVRSNVIAEPHHNDFFMASATLRGRLGDVEMTTAANIVRHEVKSVFDATAAAAFYGLGGAARYDDERNFRLFDGEVRFSGGRKSGLNWLAGLSFLAADSSTDGRITEFPVGPGTALKVVDARQEAYELAAYGEVSAPVIDDLRATAGARLIRSVIENEKSTQTGDTLDPRRKTGFTPSVSLAWTPARGAMVFARYAGAFRPGGLSPTNAADGKYEADELATFEIGGRLARDYDRVTVSASLFRTLWEDIQTDYLLDNGLVATRNAGDGRIFGAEISTAWKPVPGWTFDFGALFQRARLVRSATGAQLGEDRRLPVVPNVALRTGATRRFTLPHWVIDAGIHATYIGRARLSFDPGLDRLMGNYALTDLSLAARSGGWMLAGTVANLFNSRADSFAFGNPFSVHMQNQYTPLRPRAFQMTIGRNW